MTRRIVKFQVSGELIAQSLALPDDTSLLHIVVSDRDPRIFWFYVEHDDLPELLEGESVPEISPKLTADYEKRPGTWIQFDWNLPKSEK